MTEKPEIAGQQPVPVDELQALIGNSETKCVLQLLATPGEELYNHDFNARFAQAQEPPGHVRYSFKTLQEAIVQSHSLAGAYEAANDTSLKTWTATKAPDSEVADSLAGHNLALSAGYGLSLGEFWGKTSKAKTESLRGPQARIRIFEALSGTKPGQRISIPDLSASLGFTPDLIHSHIQRLYSFGFVEYDATELQHQAISFEIVGNPDPAQSTLSRDGIRMKDNRYYAGVLTARTQIGQKLMQFKDAGKTTFSYDELGIPVNISYASILTGVLLREGVLKRHHKVTTSADQFSQISLTEEQREIIDRVVYFYHGLRDNDQAIIAAGIGYATDIMQDKKLVAELLEKAYNTSPNVRSKTYEERAADIGLLLVGVAEGEELSTRSIQQQLDEGKLTLGSVGGILRKMRQAGVVTGHKEGNQTYWKLASEQQAERA